jgi:hypothetical protein
MGKHLTPHVKKLSPKDSPATNKTKTATIGTRLSGSGNSTVAATGAGVTTSSGNLDGAITANTNAKIDSKTATSTLKTKNQAAVDKANAAGIILEQQFPGDPDTWVTYGYEYTLEESADTVVPGMVENPSVSQGDVLGTADVHHDPLEGADDYQVWVTKGLVGDIGSYIDVTNYEESTSKSSTTVTLPPDYLGVPLNWIIVARNSAGSGPDSTPFGGGRKIN